MKICAIYHYGNKHMHDYLRAVGFSKIKQNKDVRDLITFVQMRPTKEYVTSENDNESAFGEKAREFGHRIGISVRGEYDEDKFYVNSYYPYLLGRYKTVYDNITVEKQTDRDEYLGVCDSTKLGLALVFNIINMADYLDYRQFHSDLPFSAPVKISGLSKNAKIILPVYKTEKEIDKQRTDNRNREMMLAAAREGDPEALENLTLQDIDLFSEITKRIRHEDVLSIVESYFMPYGITCDHYSVMGTILRVDTVENTFTEDQMWLLALDCNGLIFDVCINKKDLLGEPDIGRRFRGVIWAQGIIDFSQIA